MLAWRVHDWGGPENMRLEEISIPVPGPGEVLIRNHAASLNFYDLLQIQGKYQVKPPFPFTPCGECAGVVEAVGEGVHRVVPGNRVVSIPFLGCLAQFVVAREEVTFEVPEAMSFPVAAVLPVVYQTSYFALRDRGQIRAGEWLLVHAGASGVGMAAIQLGKAWGARIIATAGSAGKLEFSRAQGAEFVLNYNDAGWVDEVKRITGGRGADVIYDPVGGDVFDLSTKCIAPLGRILIVGFASGRIPAVAANRVLLKNMSVVGVLWGNHIAAHPEYAAMAHNELLRLYEAGHIRPAVAGGFHFPAVVEAFQALSGRRVLGKIAVEM